MPLEKIPASLLMGLAISISVTKAPMPMAPPKNERRVEDGVPAGIKWSIRIQKAGYWAHAFVELCIVAGGILGSKGVVALLLPNGKDPDCIKLTPTTAFATILVVLGGSLRYWSIREMGTHFTYGITLLKDHKLVTTGPYSMVRHPAYTGLILMTIGKMIWYTSSGSWLRESMVYQMRVSWLFIAPVMFCILANFLIALGRTPVEEAILKKEFGKEWVEWGKRVPYRLFPGIF